MPSPVRLSFAPSLLPFSVSVAQAGTVTVRCFPGWVLRVRPFWS